MTWPREERLERLARAAAATVLLLALAALLLPAPLGGRASYIIVSGTSMEPRYETLDLVVMMETGAYAPGDLITYRIPDGDPGAGSQVIHRITGGDGTSGYVTQGDNRSSADPWNPRDRDVVGEELFGVPGGGRWLLWLRQPVIFGALLAAIAVGLVVAKEPEPTEDEGVLT